MRQFLDPGTAPDAGAADLDALTADVVRNTGASIGMLYLLPPEEPVLWLTLVSGASPRVAAPWSRASLDSVTPLSDAIRQRRLVWLGSQEEIAHRYPHLSVVVPYAFLLAAAPFVSGDGQWGGIVLVWPVWHPPGLSPRETETISAFCRSATRLLEQADAHGRPLLPSKEPRSLPQPERQAPPGQAAAAFRFTDRLPVGACELDLDGRVTFLNPAGADLVGDHSGSLLGNYPWEVLRWLNGPVFEDHYRFAVITRRPASFTTVRPPHTPLRFELYPSGNGVSVHITPTVERETTGPERPPPPGDPAGAMGLYHLTHLSAALSEAVGVSDVVDIVTEQIVPAFGPQGLILFVIEEGRLHAIGRRGYRADFVRLFDDVPLDSDAPNARSLSTEGATFFPTFADFQRAHPEAPRYESRNAWAFLPLATSGRPIGSLALSYDRPRSFLPAERATLTALSGLIAQALDRARLYDATHDLAHALQAGLLPRSLPRIPGLDVAARYLPVGHGPDIGGDFYDLVRTEHMADTDRTRATPAEGLPVTAVIGDVQGHNTAAAALMGQVRTAVHAFAAVGIHPGELLTLTSCLLTDIDPDMLTSCLIVRLDPGGRRALIASAGHPPPVLLQPGGRAEVFPVTPGPLLGIAADSFYPTTELALAPDSVLALYTDGLVEIPGTDIGDCIDALAQQLGRTASRDLDELADSLVVGSGRPTRAQDDIALLLLRPRVAGGTAWGNSGN